MIMNPHLGFIKEVNFKSFFFNYTKVVQRIKGQNIRAGVKKSWTTSLAQG